MILVTKTKGILRDNSGETMIEVLVAFTVLSIMLLVFSQGIAWATESELNAGESRNKADQGMIDLQSMLASGAVGDNPKQINVGTSSITRYVYTTSNGNTYVVYKPAT